MYRLGLCGVSLSHSSFLLQCQIYPVSSSSPFDRLNSSLRSTEVNGPIKANFISTAYGLDGPQLSGINSTSWDWWYFDAISPDLKTSICIIFFTAPSTGFPFVDPLDGVTSVGVFYSLPNGTIGFRFINADEAIVITVADGSSGNFSGTGARWFGASDLSKYNVTINSPASGVVGTFTLTSKAPAHYPCGPAEAGQNMMVGTNIGWSNAIPDAVGVVDFQIGGSALVFTGVGYHDKVIRFSAVDFAADL